MLQVQPYLLFVFCIVVGGQGAVEHKRQHNRHFFRPYRTAFSGGGRCPRCQSLRPGPATQPFRPNQRWQEKQESDTFATQRPDRRSKQENDPSRDCEILCEPQFCEQVRIMMKNSGHRKTNAGRCSVRPNRARGTTERPRCGLPAIAPETIIRMGKLEGFTHRHRDRQRFKDIVKGNPARPNSYPWLVSLQYQNPKGEWVSFCGGTLLSNKYVISAGHCFLCSNVANYRVVAGEFDLATEADNAQHSCIEDIIVHPSFMNPPDAAYIESDAAIVVLSEPFKYNDYVSPICLPSERMDWKYPRDPEEKFVLTGWGTTEWQGKPAMLQQEVVLQVMPWEKCWDFYKFVADDMMCAIGLEFGQHGCQGDSGSPLAAYRRDRYVLAGIMSHGQQCGAGGSPAVFTHVPSLVRWLKWNIRCRERCFSGD